MNVVGRVGSFITQGVYSVATPFHPFGGAVDIIVVKQHDGSFRTTPWYVRFGKFQGVLKGTEKLVRIEVNGVEADFHMHLDNSGEAYFVSEVDPNKNDGDQGLVDSGNFDDGNTGLSNVEDGNDFGGSEVEVRDERTNIDMDRLERADSDAGRIFYEFQDDESSEFGSSRYENVDGNGNELESQGSSSEVVLVSVDGHMLTARLSSSERNAENVQLNTPQFHLGPGEGTEEYNSVEAALGDDYLSNLYSSGSKCTTENVSNRKLSSEDQLEPCEDGRHLDHAHESDSSPKSKSTSLRKNDVFKSCLELPELAVPSEEEEAQDASDRTQTDDYSPACEDNAATNRRKHVEFSSIVSIENTRSELYPEALEISLCGKSLYPGMSLTEAEEAFEMNRLSAEEFRLSGPYIVKNEELIVRVQGKYLPWDKAAHILLGKAAFGLDLPVDAHDIIRLKQETPEEKEGDPGTPSTPSRRWKLWPIPFRRAKSLDYSPSNASSSEDFFVDSESVLSESQGISRTSSASLATESTRKQMIRTNMPTTDQIASLNLQEGQNTVKFTFSTRVLGTQKVEAHIYLWKWNTRIVISDVDGTITKSDVLGQFMPLVGRDWSHSGIARLFSAIKENGYQLLFLSARAIVQSYLTKSFLFNLKQDGNCLPNGPVVISPDGLFPSLYREVIRRAPHEFKIACLEDIKALFPPGYNPFYAGFGNRDTDELSYRKIGIPNGKIFIINPKGEVAINRRIDVKSYTSLHTMVHDMFPPTSLANDTPTVTSLVEQEEYNDLNYWKMPLPDYD